MSRWVCFCYGPQGVDANIRALTSIKSNRPQKINYFIGKFRQCSEEYVSYIDQVAGAMIAGKEFTKASNGIPLVLRPNMIKLLKRYRSIEAPCIGGAVSYRDEFIGRLVLMRI